MLYNREFENELKDMAKEVTSQIEKSINENISVTITDDMMNAVYGRHPEILETIQNFQYSDEAIRKMVRSVLNAIIMAVDFDSLLKISAVRLNVSCFAVNPERVRSFLRKYVRITMAHADLEARKEKAKEGFVKKEILRRAMEIVMLDGDIGYDVALASAVELILDDEKLETQTSIIIDRIERIIKSNINPFIVWALEHDAMISEEIEAYKYRQKTFWHNIGDFKEVIQLKEMETKLFGVLTDNVSERYTIQAITDVIQKFLNARIAPRKKDAT